MKGVKIELFSFCAAFPNMVSFTYQLHISDTVLNHLSSRPVYFNGFSLTDFEYTILQNSQGKVFSSKLLPSLASTQLNFNFNFEAEIALFPDNTADHPTIHPPNHLPTHPPNRESSKMEQDLYFQLKTSITSIEELK